MKSLICLVALAFTGKAQIFQPGSSLDDVYAKFGAPKKWWLPETQRYLNGFEESRTAAGAGTVVQDVYERKTATNTYEIRLIRLAEPRESGVHPKIRVSGLEFLVDKPETFQETLADIGEARTICEAGCNLYGLDDTNRYSVLAYPINPFTAQTDGAIAAAYGYKPDVKADHKYNWGLKLNYKKRDRLLGIKDAARPDWVNGKIENVQIRPISLDYELRTWGGHAQPQTLGSWKP